MSIFRNLRIGSKLAVGFCALLFLLLIIVVVALTSLIDMDRDYTNIFNYPASQYDYVRNIELDLVDLRRIVALAALNTGSQHELDGLEEEIALNRANIVHNIVALRSSLYNDPMIGQYVKSARMRQIHLLENLIYIYVDGFAYAIIELARAGQQNSAHQAHALGLINESASGLYLTVHTEFVSLYQDIQDYMNYIAEQISISSQNILLMVIVLAAIAFVFGIIVAFKVTRMITKPVSEVVSAIESVAKGNLNVNIAVESKDEMGTLAKSTRSLISTLRRLMQDMDNMAEDHEKGEIDTFIDASGFDGDYGIVADKINGMLRSALDTQNTVVGTFIEIAKGNFSADMEKLPGKKAMLNLAIDDMRHRIESVSDEINMLIDAAANKGNLAVHIDEAKYSGGWLTIMEGLNYFADVVNAPIIEVRDVMNRLGQEGLLDMRIEGNYSGDFLTIKNVVNSTMDNLGGIITDVSHTLATVSSGDLRNTIAIERSYIGAFATIKDSINNIAQTLQRSMSEINMAATNVLEGANRLTNRAMELADGSSAQTASLDELKDSIELIKLQTRQFSDNASEAKLLSNKSTNDAQEGNLVMKHMLSTMEEIKNSSNNISNFIKVIQDIALQTNLLSLNAAIEAAHAGDRGKGFNIVAEEVRELATKSHSSANESTKLIQDSISIVETGASAAHATSESLDTIVRNMNEILTLINNITTAASDQTDMISQISAVLLHTANTVQENSKFAQETAATAEELNSQAAMLQNLVSYFRL